jgi:hypothetical protein
MTAAAERGTAPAASSEAEGLRISQIKGAALKPELCSFPDRRSREQNHHLWIKLGMICGRLQPSGGAGFSVIGNEGSWLTLAEIDPPAIEAVVARHQGIYKGWRLEGDGGGTILEQIDQHWLLAQRRKRDGAL